MRMQTGDSFEESLSFSPNKRDFVCCQQPNAFLERIFGLKTTITPETRQNLVVEGHLVSAYRTPVSWAKKPGSPACPAVP
jgi:hypothetical protein